MIDGMRLGWLVRAPLWRGLVECEGGECVSYKRRPSDRCIFVWEAFDRFRRDEQLDEENDCM